MEHTVPDLTKEQIRSMNRSFLLQNPPMDFKSVQDRVMANLGHASRAVSSKGGAIGIFYTKQHHDSHLEYRKYHQTVGCRSSSPNGFG